MADHELRDKSNRFLGKIRTLSNGRQELRDHKNNRGQTTVFIDQNIVGYPRCALFSISKIVQ